MRTYLSLLTFLVCFYAFGNCAQPYLPEQIVFTVDVENATYAIDEINQRAFISRTMPVVVGDRISYVMAQFPYAASGSPQVNYTTELTGLGQDFSPCSYTSYWAYGGNENSDFPEHWKHGTALSVGNYLEFFTSLVLSSNSTVNHWHSVEKCFIPPSDVVPCEEIFFEKESGIPIEYRYMVSKGQQIKHFTNVKIGSAVDKYFETIPKNWSTKCQDENLSLKLSDYHLSLTINQTAGVSLWISTPPHLVNGNNDTVIVDWTIWEQYEGSFTWTPKQFVFNGDNYMKKQTLYVKRVKAEPQGYAILSTKITGGGMDGLIHQESIDVA